MKPLPKEVQEMIDTAPVWVGPFCKVCDHIEEVHGPFNMQHDFAPQYPCSPDSVPRQLS